MLLMQTNMGRFLNAQIPVRKQAGLEIYQQKVRYKQKLV